MSGAMVRLGPRGQRVARWLGDPRTHAVFVFTLLTLCLSALLVSNRLDGNECDVLPAAKQFMDPGWLARDWYLNLPIGYRYAFNVPVGLALKVASFPVVANVGRVVIAALFAAAAVSLFRAFGVSVWLCLPWVYLFERKQDLAAAEWILKALETKVFAYVAALFALAALARGRYARMAACLGVALSFHLLVGIYASLCTAACMLLGAHRQALREVWRWAWPALLTGAPGLFALAAYATGRGTLDPEAARAGAEIYVQFRVPHHVLPETFAPSYRFWFALCAGGFLLMRLLPSNRYRLLGQYGLAACALFGVGLVVAHFGRVSLLRFYWFRYPDVMLPLLGWFALAMLLHDALGWLRRAKHALLRAVTLPLQFVPLGATCVMALWCLVPYGLDTRTRVLAQELRPKRFSVPEIRGSAMTRWIRKHTEPDARFLIDPGLENFYVEAERAVFVSFKHSPQSEGDIVEWYRRLTLLNGGRTPRGKGFGALREIALSYRLLSPAQLEALAREYDLDYLLTKATGLPFQRVHREPGWALYRFAKKPRE